MSDLIDREALLRQIDIDSEGEPGFYGDTWQFIDTIKRMPSAQPEIIRCKDCKYWVPGYITDNDDFIPPKCGEWQQMVGHSSDDYCSLAERREVQDENDKTTNNTTNA